MRSTSSSHTAVVHKATGCSWTEEYWLHELVPRFRVLVLFPTTSQDNGPGIYGSDMWWSSTSAMSWFHIFSNTGNRRVFSKEVADFYFSSTISDTQKMWELPSLFLCGGIKGLNELLVQNNWIISKGWALWRKSVKLKSLPPPICSVHGEREQSITIQCLSLTNMECIWNSVFPSKKEIIMYWKQEKKVGSDFKCLLLELFTINF